MNQIGILGEHEMFQLYPQGGRQFIKYPVMLKLPIPKITKSK